MTKSFATFACLFLLGCSTGIPSSPNTGSVSGVPGGAFAVQSVLADYSLGADVVLIRLSTDPAACAAELAGASPPPSTRFIELDVIRTDSSGTPATAIEGSYALPGMDATPTELGTFVQGVYYAYDDQGGFGDQWNTDYSGTIDLVDAMATSLRGSFDITFKQVTDLDNGATQKISGSFDAAHCQAPQIPND